MESTELAYAGAARQAEMIRSGEATSVEIVQACLDRIEQHDGLLNSFRVVFREQALIDAAAADASRGPATGPLHGVPVAVKDDTDVAGHATRYGSNASDQDDKQADAEIVKRLRAAGAVLIGKTNVPELCVWPFTETEAFGVTRNPWNTGHTPGGSSGGSAAAVAAGFAGVAVGTDGGGSVRIPAACCGLFGIKTQRGRIPVAPKVDPWTDMSVYGPLSRNVADAALFMDATADRLGGESTFISAVSEDPGRLRVGWTVKPPLPGPVSKDQKAAIERVMGVLEGLGHTTEKKAPKWGPMIPAFIPRYLRGIAGDVEDQPNPDLLDKRTKAMYRFSKAISDKTLQKALDKQSDCARIVDDYLTEFDVLVTPGLALQQLPVGKFAGKGGLWTFNGVARFTPFTAPFNMTGHPGINIPAGFDSDGLPLSVQIVGRPNSERQLISIAAQLEQAMPWADKRPNLPA